MILLRHRTCDAVAFADAVRIDVWVCWLVCTVAGWAILGYVDSNFPTTDIGVRDMEGAVGVPAA